MFFSDWRTNPEYKDARISERLFWEYDMKRFDWWEMRTVVVKRILERGRFEDFYAAIRLYGGLRKFNSIIKEIPVLSKRDIAFVEIVFGIKEKDLQCYTRKRLRETHLNSSKN